MLEMKGEGKERKRERELGETKEAGSIDDCPAKLRRKVSFVHFLCSFTLFKLDGLEREIEVRERK